MAEMMILVPEELKDFGEAVLATMGAVKNAMASAASGRSLEYEGVECELAEATAGVERAGHRAEGWLSLRGNSRKRLERSTTPRQERRKMSISWKGFTDGPAKAPPRRRSYGPHIAGTGRFRPS